MFKLELTDNHKSIRDLSCVPYTENGEITYNTLTGEYTVWDETYAYIVCKTNYPKVAEAALQAYDEHYLDKQS